ncbi:MAG: peptide chain release factor N(5)-glutamine methyltransferase [Gemmobacter sp.]
MTGAEALVAARRRLEAAGLPGSDAMVLMAHAFGLDHPRHADRPELAGPLPAEVADRFDKAMAARLARQPVSHIRGWRQFWKHRFNITPDVLDPRPDTETLVAAALGEPFGRVLDLGTGSGCILISVLVDRPDATGLGTDLSPAALAVARANARDLGVAARAEFALSDWFADVAGRFDLILSNPPYIAADELPGLAPEVRDHEPLMALSPGGDGLGAYRTIARGVRRHLTPGGRVLLEIGPTQGAAVAALLRDAGLTGITILPDLDRRDRVVAARAPQGDA